MRCPRDCSVCVVIWWDQFTSLWFNIAAFWTKPIAIAHDAQWRPWEPCKENSNAVQGMV